MGNRFSRRRDAPASTAGTVVTEEKAEAEPATTDQEESSEITQTQEVVETEKLKTSESDACSSKDESESKEVQSLASAPQNDAESESTVKETPPPVQAEPLISAIKPPEPEGFAQPEPVTEAQLAPKPEPEPVLEPEPPSHQKADAESILEPDEPLEQYTDLLNQEPLPKSFFSSPPLIDLSVPDIASAPAFTPVSELSNISAAEGRVEPAGGSTLEPKKFTETSEFLEKEEAVGCMKTPENDADEENVRDVLQNLELKGNDLLNDLIQGEVKIPEDTPITDVSTSIELM